MDYKLQLIKKKHQKTSTWSGGTTTELFIYPKDASYADRNFKWRLSSATVEQEESNFTYLQGVNRWIMTLEGDIKLQHKGYGEKELKPFEPYNFSGQWETKSFGKVRDFNLMLKEDCSGEISSINIEKDMSREIYMHRQEIKNNNFSKVSYALYCVKGQILIRTFHDEVKLNEGDILIINCNLDVEEHEQSPKLYVDVHNNGEDEAVVTTAIVYQI
ncbi:HutD family protein [Clostridium sp. KNHs214]|uniref:HutD family protein n=1 Tax=Clostridium sp. KNHs214 TaxID=1540257 RepID=UPI000690327A|nr:HutD family protein [Clostridium sp. KNHs214]